MRAVRWRVMDDPFHLDRFVAAQVESYDRALAELHRGRKTTHWMWFVFPQLRGLGPVSYTHLTLPTIYSV